MALIVFYVFNGGAGENLFCESWQYKSFMWENNMYGVKKKKKLDLFKGYSTMQKAPICCISKDASESTWTKFKTHIFYIWYTISQMCTRLGHIRENGRSFSEACTEKEQSVWQYSPKLFHKLLISLPLWVLLSHLQNETQRLHQKPSCLSDAACCNVGQLRWMLCPLRSLWKRLAFFFFFFAEHFLFLITYQRRAKLLYSWQPLGWTIKRRDM